MKSTWLKISGNAKSALFALVLLFALAPCAVKATVLKSAHIEWNTVLNKSKSAHNEVHSCYHAIKKQHETIADESAGRIAVYFSSSFIFNVLPVEVPVRVENQLPYSKTLPLYILFKRLKYHLPLCRAQENF